MFNNQEKYKVLLEQYVEKLYLSKVDDLLDEKCSKMCEEKIFQLQSILNAIICVDERFEFTNFGVYWLSHSTSTPKWVFTFFEVDDLLDEKCSKHVRNENISAPIYAKCDNMCRWKSLKSFILASGVYCLILKFDWSSCTKTKNFKIQDCEIWRFIFCFIWYKASGCRSGNMGSHPADHWNSLPSKLSQRLEEEVTCDVARSVEVY